MNPAERGLLFRLIDDIESASASGFICSIGLCSWFERPVGEAAGPFPPPAAGAGLEVAVPARGKSRLAWHVRPAAGAPAVDLFLDLHGPAFPRVLYPDLGAYAGIAFWARTDLASSRLTVAIEDDRVLAPGYEQARRSGKPWFTREVKLEPTWRRHIISFDEFEQVQANGLPTGAKVNTSAVWSLHFLTGLLAGPSDFWIDDLALLCRGQCPRAPYELPPSPHADALDEGGLTWVSARAAEPPFGCGELASLSMSPFDQWRAGPGEKVFLRVRVKAAPSAAVPLWAWQVQRASDGQAIPVTVLDEGYTLVSVPVTSPGQYRVRAHSHYPGNESCAVEVTATATAN